MPSVKVKADISEFEKITAFIEENVCSSQKILSEFCIIADELFSNIINYSTATYVDFSVEKAQLDGNNAIKLVFKDNGIQFNPLEKDDPDTTLSAQQREVGGLGIFLVKKLSDSFSYMRNDSENIFTVTKKI